MKSPLVSVIMPAYNHEKYVGEAIESVLNQTFEDFEFIIINDGSTDGTESVIKSYNDPRISYYAQKNMDAPHTINKGLSLAKGKYTSIINSDDMYHPERLGYLVEIAETSGAVFIMTGLEYINENSEPITDKSNPYIDWYDKLKSNYLDSGSIEQTFFIGNIAVTSSNFFFKSTAFEEIGIFNTSRYTHDYDIALRCLLKYKNKFQALIHKKFLFYRLHPKNTLKEYPTGARQEVFKLLMSKLPQFIENEKDRALVCSALERFERINGQFIREINRLENTVENLENTISWKITAPLRWVGGKVFKF